MSLFLVRGGIRARAAHLLQGSPEPAQATELSGASLLAMVGCYGVRQGEGLCLVRVSLSKLVRNHSSGIGERLGIHPDGIGKSSVVSSVGEEAGESALDSGVATIFCRGETSFSRRHHSLSLGGQVEGTDKRNSVGVSVRFLEEKKTIWKYDRVGLKICN